MKNHTSEDNIKCPYCDYEDKNSWEFTEDDGVWECGHCGKEFKVSRNITITYNSYPTQCKGEAHDFEYRSRYIRKREYLGKEQWREIPEADWEYYKILVCKKCLYERFEEITKEEYEFSFEK